MRNVTYGKERDMAKKIIGMVVVGLLLVYFLTLILHVSSNLDQYQWDFRTHRKAGEIFASGSNPYDSEILFPQAQTRFLYTYPPATLFFYRLFAMPGYKTSFTIFLILKCGLLIGLIYFWKREFLKEDADTLFYVFCLLAFNSAVFLDMIAGNINLVQQALLWLAFSFYIKRRFKLFCLFTLISASFKITPIFFLVLLILSNDKDRFKYFFGAGAAFGAYLLIQYVIVPDLFTGFIQNALVVVGEPGGVVPSTNKLIGVIVQSIGKAFEISVPAAAESAIFLTIAAIVVFYSFRAIKRLNHIQIENKATIKVFLACLVYALIHPRFKDYGYILLLVPSYYIIKNIHCTKIAPVLFVLFVLSCERMMLPIASSIYDLIWAYYPLMIAYCVWGIYLYEIFNAMDGAFEAKASGERKKFNVSAVL